MFRVAFCLLAGAVVLLAGGARAGAAPQSATEVLEVPGLIQDLSDADTAVRQRATNRLHAIGDAARPELLKAAQSDDPETRARAVEILRKLPWSRANDPPAVRALLDRYGSADDYTRMVIIGQLDEAPGGIDALLRLLSEESNEAVRWVIVAALYTARSDEAERKILGLDTSADDPPVLLLVGQASLERSRANALKLFRRAIDADAKRAAADTGMLAIAYDELTGEAMTRGDFTEAAALLRRQVPRDALPRMMRRRARWIDNMDGQRERPSLARLMALHTYFGPLPNLHADLRAWGPVLVVDPEPVEPDAAADAAPRKGAAAAPPEADPQAAAAAADNVPAAGNQPLDHAITRFVARFAPPPPLPVRWLDLRGEEHYAAASFFIRNKLFAPAEMELHAALAAPRKSHADVVDANANFALAQVAAERNDDDAAANFLETGMAIRMRRQHELQINGRGEDDIWAEIHWRRARAAHARGDAAETANRVRDLLHLTPSNTDLTLGAIEWLKETARPAEARTMFEKVYVQSRAKLDAAPERLKPGRRNDLAWLCARAGERLDEAVELARAAVAASPDNAAFLDTLAEACYRTGRRDEAIRLEARALELMPDNDFMKQQLERFRSGAK